MCNVLHGVMMYNGASADRIHDACKLLKEVEKMTCDIHGLSDLNQYDNDDGDDAAMNAAMHVFILREKEHINTSDLWRVIVCLSLERMI